MSKLLYFIIGFIAMEFFLLPPSVYAHFPATDKTITVILHVDPDDSPTPGQQAFLYFDFGDTTNRFKLENCLCTVLVSEENKIIYQQSLVEKTSKTPSIWGASLPFVFPRRDVYKISLSGKPSIQNAFQPFSLSWNFRVDQYPLVGGPTFRLSQPLQKQSDPTFIYFASGFLGIILIIGVSLFLAIRH